MASNAKYECGLAQMQWPRLVFAKSGRMRHNHVRSGRFTGRPFKASEHAFELPAPERLLFVIDQQVRGLRSSANFARHSSRLHCRSGFAVKTPRQGPGRATGPQAVGFSDARLQPGDGPGLALYSATPTPAYVYFGPYGGDSGHTRRPTRATGALSIITAAGRPAGRCSPRQTDMSGHVTLRPPPRPTPAHHFGACNSRSTRGGSFSPAGRATACSASRAPGISSRPPRGACGRRIRGPQDASFQTLDVIASLSRQKSLPPTHRGHDWDGEAWAAAATWSTGTCNVAGGGGGGRLGASIRNPVRRERLRQGASPALAAEIGGPHGSGPFEQMGRDRTRLLSVHSVAPSCSMLRRFLHQLPKPLDGAGAAT